MNGIRQLKKMSEEKNMKLYQNILTFLSKFRFGIKIYCHFYPNLDFASKHITKFLKIQSCITQNRMCSKHTPVMIMPKKSYTNHFFCKPDAIKETLKSQSLLGSRLVFICPFLLALENLPVSVHF